MRDEIDRLKIASSMLLPYKNITIFLFINIKFYKIETRIDEKIVVKFKWVSPSFKNNKFDGQPPKLIKLALKLLESLLMKILNPVHMILYHTTQNPRSVKVIFIHKEDYCFSLAVASFLSVISKRVINEVESGLRAAVSTIVIIMTTCISTTSFHITKEPSP